MALEDSVKGSEVSPLGNVEQAVRDIASSEYDAERSSDERYMEAIRYIELIKEKLPRSLDHIFVMGDYIFKEGLIPLERSMSLSADRDGDSIRIGHINRWIKLLFKKQKLKGICLYQVHKKYLKYNIKRKEKQILNAKNSTEFSIMLSNLILGAIERDDYSEYMDYKELISVITGIPKKISEQYARKRDSIVGKDLTSACEQLESLDESGSK
jgi:hypothetical protein